MARTRSVQMVLALVLVYSEGCGDDPTRVPELEDAGLEMDAAGEVDSGEDSDMVEDVGLDVPDLEDDTLDGGTDAIDLRAEPDVAPFDPGDFDHGQLVDFAPDAIAIDEELFPLGVQAGAMRSESVLLWTYATDRATKRLRVWRPSDNGGQVFLVHDERAEPSPDGYFHVSVDELAPGTVYLYAFLALGVDDGFASRSVIGRVRTALAPGALEPITIGATSCTRQFYAPWESLEMMAREHLDLFVHLGDMSYNDGAETLEDYRQEWRETLSDPGYLALYPSTGLYATWDDHEVSNDYDPETIDPGQMEAAREAYFETVAVERGPNGELWNSYLWGATAEFIVLDCRSERRPSTRETDEAIYISTAQMDWLKERLLSSPAHFKIVLNSVAITDMPVLWDVAIEDRWEGYEAQREELLDFIIDNDISNVWFLTGDFHLGFISHVEASGPRSRLVEIAPGPGGNGPNPLAFTLVDDPQFPFSSVNIEVSTTLTFDPIADEVHVRFVDRSGEVLFDDVVSQRAE